MHPLDDGARLSLKVLSVEPPARCTASERGRRARSAIGCGMADQQPCRLIAPIRELQRGSNGGLVVDNQNRHPDGEAGNGVVTW